MSNEELKKSSAPSVQETPADGQTLPTQAELAEVKPSSKPSVIAPVQAEKEPIDWFSVFLIVLVLANIGYWLATRNRNVGPDMRVFLASPAEQTFPINDDKKAPTRGVLPPEIERQVQPSKTEIEEAAAPESLAQPQSPSRAAMSSSSAAEEFQTVEKQASNKPIDGSVANSQESNVPERLAGDRFVDQPNELAIDEQGSLFTQDELPQAPFAPYFKGKPLEVATAYKSGVSHEIKRDFLVNQYMYAAEVLDRYRVDTKPIFDCDANAQKFSVSGDTEAELRAVQQTIKVSAELLRKTYNQEIAKALSKTKLKGQALEQAQRDAREAEALIEVSFSRSAEKYEDVLRRLKAQ